MSSRNRRFGRNPAMREETFRRAARAAEGAVPMTVAGTANKAILLVGIVAASALWVWYHAIPAGFSRQNPNDIALVMHRLTPFLAAGIAGFIVAIVTTFKPTIARYTAIPYAILEGLVIGALASMLELRFPSIAIQAAALTFGTLFGMLVIYRTGLVKVTDRFRRAVMAGMFAVMLVYLATFVLGFFHVQVPYIHGSGLIGIGFSVLVIGLASAMLLVDFDMIERGAEMNAPAWMEWYGAFALLITLVWLYIEFLRLLSKLRSR